MPWIGRELDEDFDMTTMKVKDIPADMTARLSRPGGYITISLADVLEQVADYFDSRADVEDGDYGVPQPNEELQLLSLVRDAQEAFCDGEPNT
jgi:hypothetical protein